MRQCEIAPTYCGKPSELDKRVRRILPLTLMKKGWAVAKMFRAEGFSLFFGRWFEGLGFVFQLVD